eukprot:166587-Rhodomonas_salina.1
MQQPHSRYKVYWGRGCYCPWPTPIEPGTVSYGLVTLSGTYPVGAVRFCVLLIRRTRISLPAQYAWLPQAALQGTPRNQRQTDSLLVQVARELRSVVVVFAPYPPPRHSVIPLPGVVSGLARARRLRGGRARLMGAKGGEKGEGGGREEGKEREEEGEAWEGMREMPWTTRLLCREL